MKKHFVSAAVAAVALVLAAGCGKDEKAQSAQPPLAGQVFGGPGQAAQPDRIAQLPPSTRVASVNGTAITAGALDQELNRVVAQIARNNNLPPQQFLSLRPMLVPQAVDSLISQALLTQAVESSDAVVTGEEVDAEMAQIPPEAIQQATAQGMTEALIRQNITQGLKIRKMLGDTSVTDEEVAEFYNSNLENFQKPETIKVSHILLAYAGAERATATRSKEEAKAETEALLARIRAGEAFAELAAASSDCPSSQNGGLLGDSVARGSMVPAFEDAAFALKEGEISEVIETPFGYHIIMVEKHDPAGTATLEEVSAGLKQSLEGRKQMAALDTLLAGLREKATISYEPGFEPPATPAPVPPLVLGDEPAPAAPAAAEAKPVEEEPGPVAPAVSEAEPVSETAPDEE